MIVKENINLSLLLEAVELLEVVNKNTRPHDSVSQLLLNDRKNRISKIKKVIDASLQYPQIEFTL
jgi:DNA-binding protein H-NS